MEPSYTYLVLVEKVINIPGDERSRTNPGHGYPAHQVNSIEVREFSEIAGLKEWIRSNEALLFDRPKFRAFRCLPLEVKATLDIKVDIADAQSEKSGN